MNTTLDINNNVNNLKQPKGLYILFLTELWERFSYYGMRALFILYMTNGLLFSDNKSYAIYGIYGTLVYITPLLGGMIADRLFGYRRCVITGGVLMALAQFSLMVQRLDFFYVGLALLIVGNGLLKPNISSQLGKLYKENDERRNPGFTLFYVGVNIGGFLSPILCGYVGQTYGWHYGFGLAGVGMLLGLTVFILGKPYLEGHGESPVPQLLKERVLSFLPISISAAVNLGILIAIPVVVGLFLTQITGWLLGVISVVVYLALIMMALRSEKSERNKIFALLFFMFCAMVFWAFNEQAGSSLNLFAEREINRTIFGYVIPASMFQATNPIFIFLLGPLFANLWIVLNRKKMEPTTSMKSGFGIMQLGIGFAIVAYGAHLAGIYSQSSMWWLILGYFFMTTGELCVEPIGISMVTKLSPTKMVGLMMGCWYLSDGAVSNFLAAKIASFTSVPTNELGNSVLAAGLYYNVFIKIAVVALVIGALVLLVSPLVKKLTEED